ncbi:dynein axonemal heavy chain 7-like [Euwallacea fornicatus]|uniref:dynein axonemal heavy chain 7-like n=1 Tax=Euwallacea fornicatus TaxID=995702 RepID=UPI00338D4EED
MANKPSKKYHRTKVPALPPLLNIPKDLCAVFDVRARKIGQISECISKNVTKTRRLSTWNRRVDIPAVVSTTINNSMREFAARCPITEMSRFQEKNIRSKINARKLELRFPQLLNDIMRDSKQEFKKITHCAGMNLKFKEKCPENFTISDYRFLGRTDQYNKFIFVRKQFAIRWILHYPVMRNFLETCLTKLPKQLIKLEIQRVLEVDELKAVFKEKILISSCCLQDFHKILCNILDKNTDLIFQKRPLKFLPACTMLLSKYVSKSIAHTMEDVVKFTQSCPYLKLHVDFAGKLIMTPPEIEVVMLFHALLNDLISLGEDLRVMERGRIKGQEMRKISLCLTEEFILQCKSTISSNIRELYQPMEAYLSILEERFEGVYEDIISGCSAQSHDVLFEDGCERIEFYKRHIHSVTQIPDNEYFNIGQVDLIPYRTKLHAGLKMIADSIFSNLSSQHLWEINDICDSFQLIKSRALQKPLTTEELIEIGKFMSWVRNEQLETLNCRLQASLMSLSNLITMGILDDDHIKRNCEAINWLNFIFPIIEQHSINYEQLKFEAEDKLQKVIEDINVLIINTYPLLVILDEMDDFKCARKYLNKITLQMAKIKEIQLQIEWVNKEEVCLNFPKSSYPEFDNLKDYVYPFYHLLKLSLDVQKHVSVWQYGQFDLLDYESANRAVEKFCAELKEIKKTYRKKLRQAQDENLPIRFKGTVDDPDILNWPAPLKLCGMSLNILEEFKPALVVMKIMCNKALKATHWRAMSEIAGFDLMPNAGTTLKKMVEFDLKDNLQDYEIISLCASKEETLVRHLKTLKERWESVYFIINAENYSLENFNQIQEIVDEQIMEISRMRGMVFVKPFESEVENFYETLVKIQDVVYDWNIFQTSFSTLSSIFALNGQVSQVLFQEKIWLENMDQKNLKFYIETFKNSSRKLIEIVEKSRFCSDLKEALFNLEKIQKGIDQYLETIRIRFPRLFLIPDKELMQLLSRNISDNQSLLPKIFPGIYQLKLNNHRVEAVLSSCQEQLRLKNPVKLSMILEIFLETLDTEVRNSLKHKHSECFKIFKKTPLRELMKKYPQQSLQVMAQVFWTDQVENGLKLPHNIKLLMLKQRLDNRIEEKILEIKLQKTNFLQRNIIQNLLMVDLNLKYFLQNFVKDGLVIDDHHFDWQRQLRFYCQNSVCFVRFMNHVIDYGYEYLGNNGQIMLSSQTERCYVTLLIAYFNNFFGFLKGAYQTGKSVTVKYLAETLGRAFYSFSCISKLKVNELGRVLKGVSLINYCWINIKHIEKLKFEVLSSISQELRNILDRRPMKNFIVICQSSASAQLPENFKSIFRTFSLSKPHLEIIAEGLFATIGMSNFKNCSKHLCLCLRLLEDLIGTEKHYIFKLKQLKKVVTNFQKLQSSESDNFRVLSLSISQVFSSQLQPDDLVIFQKFLSDIFADISFVPRNSNNVSVEGNYSQEFLIKTQEVFDCLTRPRTSLILLGDSGTGKTTSVKLCHNLKSDVKLHIFSPSCIDYETIIGKPSKNPNVRWRDGILLSVLKNLEQENWILFDGKMKQNFIGDMLEVLDERQLFLESLEQVEVVDNVTFVFETTELMSWSPTMISRCTVIYFPPQTMPYSSLIESWLKTCKSLWLQDHKTQIEALIKWFLPPSLETLLTLTPYITLSQNTLVNNVLTYFQLIMDEAYSENGKKDEDLKNISPWIHATLIQAGALGLSSCMCWEERKKFDEFYKQLWKGFYGYPSCLEKLEVAVPTEGIVLDYCYMYKLRGTWKLWADVLKNEKMMDMTVPTVDTIRINFILDLHLKYDRKLLIVGPRNTGKSLALKNCMKRLDENDFDQAFFCCSNFLSANNLFKELLQYKLNQRTKRLVCFLDDLNCSRKDSNTLELLRLIIDHDLSPNFREKLENTNFIASTLNEDLPRRLLKNFNVLGISEFTNESYCKIFSQSLFYSWKKSGFPGDTLNSVETLIGASMKIYLQLKESLKYCLRSCFDIKGLGRIVKGCTLLKKETFDGNKKIYLKLWVHELVREFLDCLDNLDDFKNGLDFIKVALKENFQEDASETFGENHEDWVLDKIYFGFKSNGCYEEINLKDSCKQLLQDYNNKFPKVNLLFFDYALEKMAILCRLLSISNETILHLGLTGRGRKSLTKFCSFICDQNYFQSSFVRDNRRLLTDFKTVLKECGYMAKNTVFFVSEELLNEEFLAVVDHFLRDGDVTDFYNPEEKLQILEVTRLGAQGGNKNLDISLQKVFKYFNKQCRENLHLTLSFNIGDQLRRKISSYPSLTARCSRVFWHLWPEEALQFIANHYIESSLIDKTISEQISAASVFMFKTSETTSKSFTHFNNLFIDLVVKKQKYLTAKKSRFQQGLAKLSYASSQICDMQKALAEYQPQLEEMTRNAVEMTEQIALESEEVEKASNLVREDEKTASRQAIVAQELKSECESELAQAIPILEDAISALNTLKPSDITLVKSMKNPPDAVKLVMASVCVIKEVKPDKIPDASTGRKTYDYWGPSKRILGDMNFLQTLKDFDKDHIKLEIINKIRKEFLPHKDFKPHVVAKASSAAEGLCKWIIAMDMYDKVAKEVAPKKVKLDKAEKEYAQTMRVLNEKKEEVVRIEEKLAQLNWLLDEAVKKQVKLQSEVDLCNRKLSSAQKLIGGLGGERQRWSEAAERLQRHLDDLPGDALLSCALVAYLPQLSQQKRNEKLLVFRNFIENLKIPITKKEDFKFSALLANTSKVETWIENGLLPSEFFIENALIVHNSQFHCLFIDPEFQAQQWIIKTEAGHNLLQTKLTFNDFLSQLKNSLIHGLRILIKDPQGFIPLYLTEFLSQEKNPVTINLEEVEVHGSAKTYLIGCKSNAKYSEEICSKITVINFQLTEEALTENLLRTVMEIERPESRKMSEELWEMTKNSREELKNLDSKILDTLCESKTDILEDEASIYILDQSKQLSQTVKLKQAQAQRIAEIISELKENYLDVAKYVSRQFFCINNLQKLHHSYQFSLKWFKNIYFMSILNAGKSRDIQTRCRNICQTFTLNLFQCINKGLFERHKLLFAFWLSLSVAETKSNDEIKLLKPQFLRSKICDFIKQTLGPKFLKPSFMDIQQIYNESHSLMPIIFFLTPGLNILKHLRRFAELKQVLHKFQHFSLDASNYTEAENLIKKFRIEASWVLLENCHLAPNWLWELERVLEGMDFENTHENFRLFLSVDSSAELPLEMIQNCVKVVWESQRRVKNGLLEAYHRYPITVDDYYYGCPGQQEMFSKLLYGLCRFHFILLRRYMHWNLSYKFEEANLELSQSFLRQFVNEESCLFEKLYYVVGECIYSGSLEVIEERRLVEEILRTCLNDAEKKLSKYDRSDYIQLIQNLPDETAEDLFLSHYQFIEEEAKEDFLEDFALLTNSSEETCLIPNSDLLIQLIEDLLNIFPENVPQKNPSEFVLKELKLYQKLLLRIRSNLEDLKASLLGFKILDHNLEAVALDLSQNKIPKTWLKFCYPTLQNLGNFARNFRENLTFMENFNRKEVLVRAWFFPKVLIAALKINFARNFGVEIDKVGLKCEVAEKDFEEGTIVFRGLSLLGAGYDSANGGLVELLPDIPYSPINALIFKPIVLSGGTPQGNGSKCKLSVFKTQINADEIGFLSGNRVISVQLNCSKFDSFWIKRGVCFVSEIIRN